MGVLDEAIREHLDLKRKRGADPSEIERLEREALGPVRRGPAPYEPDAVLQPSDGEGGETNAAEEANVRPARHGFFRRKVKDRREQPGPEAAPADPPGDAGDHQPVPDDEPGATIDPSDTEPPRLTFDTTPSVRPQPDLDPAQAAGEEGEASGTEADQSTPAAADPLPSAAESDASTDATPDADFAEPGATREWDVERSFTREANHQADEQAPAPSEQDDPLDETPDFLQDTPEHDRLWFEQRPPRDFNFGN